MPGKDDIVPYRASPAQISWQWEERIKHDERVTDINLKKLAKSQGGPTEDEAERRDRIKQVNSHLSELEKLVKEEKRARMRSEKNLKSMKLSISKKL
jgi:hypothetical protein